MDHIIRVGNEVLILEGKFKCEVGYIHSIYPTGPHYQIRLPFNRRTTLTLKSIQKLKEETTLICWRFFILKKRDFKSNFEISLLSIY